MEQMLKYIMKKIVSFFSEDMQLFWLTGAVGLYAQQETLMF